MKYRRFFCCLAFSLLVLVANCKPTVSAPEKPVPRLVASYSPAMELVFSLQLHPYLIGIPQSTQKIAVYRHLRPDIDNLPLVGSKMNGLNLETVVGLNPSLVLMFAGPDSIRSIERLSQFNIPCEIVEMESVAQIKQSLLSVATRLQVGARAQAVIAEMEQILQLVDKRLAAIQKREPKSIYFASNRNLLTTHSQQMLQHEMITRAGGHDVVDVKIGGWVIVSAEQLMQWNPHFIVISGQASYSLQSVMEDERFRKITAVHNGQVYRIPDAAMPWDFPGPDVALGILWLARLCYPEQFADIDMEAIKEKFYQAAYNISYRQLNSSGKKSN